MAPDTGNKTTTHQNPLRQSDFCFLPCFLFPLFTILSVYIGCSALLCLVTPPSVERCSVLCCSSLWGCEPQCSAHAFILLQKAGAKQTALKRGFYSVWERSVDMPWKRSPPPDGCAFAPQQRLTRAVRMSMAEISSSAKGEVHVLHAMLGWSSLVSMGCRNAREGGSWSTCLGLGNAVTSLGDCMGSLGMAMVPCCLLGLCTHMWRGFFHTPRLVCVVTRKAQQEGSYVSSFAHVSGHCGCCPLSFAWMPKGKI